MRESPSKWTTLKRPYLPVGSAQVVSFDDRPDLVITAPTMFLPQDVHSTRNAYLAMRASLLVTAKWNSIHRRRIRTLVIPPLGCGYGKMDVEESAKQILQAINEFKEAIYFVMPPHSYFKNDRHYINDQHDGEQPAIYMNTELPRSL